MIKPKFCKSCSTMLTSIGTCPNWDCSANREKEWRKKHFCKRCDNKSDEEIIDGLCKKCREEKK